MLLKQRRTVQRGGSSLGLSSGRSKKVDQQKLTSRQNSKQKIKSKSKDKSKQKFKFNQFTKKMTFQSPDKKQDANSSKNFSLLNFMIFQQKNCKHTANGDKCQKFSKDQFRVLQILGKGGFGRVMKVQFKKNKKIYAMKEMSKSVIMTKNSTQSVLNERELLSELRHPFLVNMIYAFQDRQNLYLIMDLMRGGDLRYQIGKYGTFPEHIVKFFICCILIGLQYMHNNNIIHRDIKPQNLVLDQKGYIRITDLGIARMSAPDNYRDTSGTPGYMAPEVINRQNHSFTVDFFALGVIAHECMLGKRPYKGYTRQEIREQILLFEASVKKSQVPNGWSLNAADFINRSLKRRQEQRLGWQGIQYVKGHPWLSDVDWQRMSNKKYPSPFIPNLNEKNYDTVSQSQYEDDYLERLHQNALLLRKKQVQELFLGYEYQQVKFL